MGAKWPTAIDSKRSGPLRDPAEEIHGTLPAPSLFNPASDGIGFSFCWRRLPEIGREKKLENYIEVKLGEYAKRKNIKIDI
jgi:hypothetical protein